MNPSASLYKRHRLPFAIIQYVVWLYHRFNLSHRQWRPDGNGMMGTAAP
jgi:hypothetical protein